MTRDKLMGAIRAKYPNAFIKPGEDFSHDHEGSIWMTGEEPGDSPFNYYHGNLDGIDAWLESHGWCAEWNDPGTVFLYRI